MRWHLLVAQLCLVGAAGSVQAEALQTCYNKTLPTRGEPQTELIVAIDQTTPLDASLKQLVADNIRSFLKPGNDFALVTFSAFTQGHYTRQLAGFRLDRLLTTDERNDIAKPALQKFDACMQRQPQLATQLAGAALRNAFAGSSSDIAKSDVIASIKAISAVVRESQAKQKVVLIVSDMLENSSVSSFYANEGHAVRRIDAPKELQLVAQQGLLSDFGGARIYVIGAGLLTDDSKNGKAYRDPKTMGALADFWSAYMNRSKAKLVEFGQPALLQPVR